MALTYTTDFKGQNANVASSVTSNTLSVLAGDFITLAYSIEDNANESAWTLSNTGSAITWTKQIETNTASNTKVVMWSGTAGASPPTTVTVLANNGAVTSKVLGTMVHHGAHATNPLPAGNLFSGTSGTDISQAITPTSAGSALWFFAGDWAETNSFLPIANCTTVGTFDQAPRQTATLIRPTTQPRADGLAFTIGETDTAGTIAWLAFEVQAALAPTTVPKYNQFPKFLLRH